MSEARKITELIPYVANNRVHSDEQVTRIASSIKEFGFNQPIVIDEDSVVLVGHGRLLAAQKLGLDKVPVFVVRGLSEAKKKAYRILDNKLQNDSSWDYQNLELELAQLTELGFELEPWGLDTLIPANGEEPEVTEDAGPGEIPDEPYIKLGDVIELGAHRVMCGDSCSAEDVATLMDGKSAHLMVTDPPYGVEYDADWRNKALRSDGSAIGGRAIGKVSNDDRASWGPAYNNFNADVAYVWHAGRHAKEVQESLEEVGFVIRCQIIWAKNNFAIGRGDYHWKHEPCWYAVRDGKTGHYCGDRSQTTLWEIDKPQKSETGHSTQKPIECMAKPIRNNSVSGDAVTDPFLGSGTTLIAADQLGRICYGMEISPAYCQVILERYQKHCATVGKPFVCKINGEPFIKPEL